MKANKDVIIDDEYYVPAPFNYGAGFGEDKLDVSRVSPLLLATGLVRFLLANKDERHKEQVLKQLRVSVDGFVSDRMCFYVENEAGLIPLAEYVDGSRPGIDAQSLLSHHFKYVTLNTAEAFDFDPAEFHKRVIPYYDGIPHAWPNHEYLKEKFMTQSSWEQKDLGHTMIDYFTTHVIEPDIKKKQAAYDWLKSIRKYKRLIVLGTVPPTIPNSVLLYDRDGFSMEFLSSYNTSEKVEKRLNILLGALIKLFESAQLLFERMDPYWINNMEELMNVYNCRYVQLGSVYQDIFTKLSFSGSELNSFIFLEECHRLADNQNLLGPLPTDKTDYDLFFELTHSLFEQVLEISQEALKRGW